MRLVEMNNKIRDNRDRESVFENCFLHKCALLVEPHEKFGKQIEDLAYCVNSRKEDFRY